MSQDPKSLVAQQIGQLVIANAEQSALIAQQAAEIERLKALLPKPAQPAEHLPTMGQPG